MYFLRGGFPGVLRVGSHDVSAVYLGDKLVWSPPGPFPMRTGQFQLSASNIEASLAYAMDSGAYQLSGSVMNLTYPITLDTGEFQLSAADIDTIRVYSLQTGSYQLSAADVDETLPSSNPTLVLASTNFDATTASTRTFTAEPVGTPTSGRKILVVTALHSTATTITGVTLDGNAMSLLPMK